MVPSAPETAEPMLIFVVDPETPAVPKLIVFVTAFAVALAKKLAVSAVVGVPPRV